MDAQSKQSSRPRPQRAMARRSLLLFLGLGLALYSVDAAADLAPPKNLWHKSTPPVWKTLPTPSWQHSVKPPPRPLPPEPPEPLSLEEAARLAVNMALDDIVTRTADPKWRSNWRSMPWETWQREWQSEPQPDPKSRSELMKLLRRPKWDPRAKWWMRGAITGPSLPWTRGGVARWRSNLLAPRPEDAARREVGLALDDLVVKNAKGTAQRGGTEGSAGR